MVGTMPPYKYQIVSNNRILASGSKVNCLYYLPSNYGKVEIRNSVVTKDVVIHLPSYYENNVKTIACYSAEWTNSEILKDGFDNIIKHLQLSVQRVLL